MQHIKATSSITRLQQQKNEDEQVENVAKNLSFLLFLQIENKTRFFALEQMSKKNLQWNVMPSVASLI